MHCVHYVILDRKDLPPACLKDNVLAPEPSDVLLLETLLLDEKSNMDSHLRS